ncbi:MAG: MFS transporter [Candidatus Nanopelagicales bacterium]
MTATRTRSLALATASVFLLNGLVISTWLSRLPATKARLDADPRTIGLVLLMSGLGSLVAMPWVGPLAARWGSRRIEVVTSISTGVLLLLMALAPNPITLGALLFVFGAGLGSWDVAMNIQGSHVDRAAGRDFMPRYHACWSVGAFVGAALGAGAAALGLPLVVHFGLAALVSVGGTLLIIARWWDDDRDDSAEQGSEHGHRLFTRVLGLIGVLTLCGTMLEGAAADWVAIYVSGDRGQADSVAAFAYAVWAVAMAASRFSGTTLIARLGRARAVRIAGLCATAGVASVLALPGIAGIVLGLVLWGAGVALVFPAAMSAGGEQPGRAADGIATVSTIGYGGFLLGPPLIGLLANEIGLATALWVLVPLGVAIAVLAPVVSPPRRPTVDA